MNQFKIDKEFENKIPPIGEDEFRQLEDNIVQAGEVYEALTVWKEEGILVDGHNRWKIIQKHPDIKYTVREMSFTDKWAAFEWMYKNQLGRRNLTDEQRTYTIGKMYEARKNAHGGDRRSVEISTTQNGRLKTKTEIKQGTAGEIARDIGVGNNTVLRAEKFAKGVDALRNVSPEAADKVLSGKADITKSEVHEIPKMKPKEIKDTAVKILNPPTESEKKKQRKVGAKVSRVSIETEEDRERMARIEAIARDMYDPTTTPEFTLDLLIEDITLNGQIYVELLANTLKDRANLITNKSKPDIAVAINNIVKDILKVRDEM